MSIDSRDTYKDSNRYDNRERQARQTSNSRERQSKCRKCDSYHQYRQCPAFNRKCAVCKKYGHFAKMCYNRNSCAIVQDAQESISETSSVNSRNISIDTVRSVNSVSKDWNFKHTSSSPYYNRSNAMVERHIQTIKKMFKKCINDNIRFLFSFIRVA